MGPIYDRQTLTAAVVVLAASFADPVHHTVWRAPEIVAAHAHLVKT